MSATCCRYRKTSSVCASMLDQEMLSREEYRKMTGEDPPRFRVGYVNWWITGSREGMLTVAWVAFQHDGVTREQVSDALRDQPAKLANLSREIEHLSAASVGNG